MTHTLMAHPREQIHSKARSVVAGYAAAKDLWNQASSLSAMLRQTQREYEDRFLYELIQNAYDAHPSDAGGEISILLDEDEGDHGVLYVANRGNPFRARNFEAICELAQSNKTPDESIGNKGVGFKSVLQVCEWPEIYSRADLTSPGFDGYCFTFARLEAYVALADGDEELAGSMRRDVSPYFLPVALDDEPAAVSGFARDGFATVIRLPLKSERAAEIARDRVARLESESVPIHLFLRRLRCLRIARVADGMPSSLSLTRDATVIDDPASDPDQRYELVDLGGQGEWFVTSRRVRGQAMGDAITRSVEEGQLDEAWLSWTRDTWVSVATRTDGRAIEPRIYTYLPMEGEAHAPLHGHLHAPFSTKLARTSVSEGVHLNAFLLDHAARAATAAVVTFASRESILPAPALVDLLAWDHHHHDRVTGSFEHAGIEMKSAQLVPIEPLPDGRARGGFDAIYCWPFEVSLVDVERLARDARAELVAASITAERLGRLERYCRAFFGSGFDPRSETRADWIATVAEALHARSAKPATWDRFYGDLSVIFEDEPEALNGRAVLFGQDGELHASPVDADDLDQPYVFFPPARERTDEDEEVEGDLDLKPPATLNKSLILMNEELTWNRQDGTRRRATPARRFLEGNRLVRRFKTVDLLEHVGRALGKGRSKALWSDSLRYAFNLYASTRNIQQRQLRDLKLRVPCASGWLPATSALFSPGWDTGRARDLADLIERASSASPELAQLGSRLLAGPDDWPFRITDRPRWVAFLQDIGVRDGLWPVPLPHSADSYAGHELGPSLLAPRFGLSDADTKRWVAAVTATQGYSPNHPYTQYRARPGASVLPGQADYAKLDEPARSLYATLVLEGLSAWANRLDVVWERYSSHHRNARDPRSWPSPLQAFLSEAEWVPTSRPGERREEVFVRPRDAWFFADVRGDGAPNFSPLVTYNVRRLFGADDKALVAAKRLGLGVWRDARHAPRLLRHLASLIEAGGLPESGYLAFRIAHEDAWLRASVWERSEFAEAMADVPIVLTRSGYFVAERPADIEDAQIYVLNDRRSLAARILESSGVPIVTVDEAADANAVKELLATLVGDRVTTLTSIGLEVFTPNGSFLPTADNPRLLDGQLGWLTDLLHLILEAKRSRRDTSGSGRRAAIVENLRRVRVCHLPSAAISVGGVTVGSAGDVRRAVPVEDDTHPTLVWLDADPPDLSDLAAVIALTPALCELLGVGDYQAEFALALERLKPITDGGPTLEDYARVLDLDTRRVNEVLAHLGAPVDSIIRDLAPVLAFHVGVASAHALLAQLGQLDGEAALAEAIGELAPAVGDPTILVAAAREAGSLPELRRKLKLDYSRFNAALRELGDPYAPIHNEAGHAQEVCHHVVANREDILHSLRASFLQTFREGGPLADYVKVRDLAGIAPDPTWLDEFDIPPTELIAEHVRAWIAEHGNASASPVALDPVSDVRRANHNAFAAVVESAMPLVEAWTRKHAGAAPEAWSFDSAIATLTEAASAGGALDFERLSESDCLAWLAREGHWPVDMPGSLDISVLDLSDADLASARNAEAAARQERARQRGIVRIDGQEFDADRDGYDAILEHVNGSLRPDLLSVALRAAPLAAMPIPHGSGGGQGGGKAKPIRPSRLSKEQAAAIGLVGETVAYAWLGSHYGDQFSPAAWKSSYRETIGEPPGDDTLGYDFEVVLKTRTVYFEVKATAGTDTAFELGESEVGAARDHAGSSRSAYWILFIANALDAERRGLFILPNPMDPANQAFFRFPGSGLTCTFKLGG